MDKRTPIVTYALAVINVVIFLIELFAGGSENIDVALRFGAMYTPLIVQEGEWYRLFTSMFLHFGAQHLMFNMISLIVIGPYPEAYFGRLRYLVIYLLSGLGGNLLVLVTELNSGRFAISAGASGAICGLLGTLVVFAMMPYYRRFFPMRRVIAAIILTLLPGLTDRTISMTAHVGGLITGFVTAYVMNYFMVRRIRRKQISNAPDPGRTDPGETGQGQP